MTTQATMNAVRDLPLVRKASTWDEVERCPHCRPFTHCVASSRVPPGLLIFTAEALQISTTLDDFNPAVPVPTAFILRVAEGREYVVNTEGYSYARYAARIVEG